MTTLARDPKGYYAVLGLDPGADAEEIRAAYRQRVKVVHPDRDPSTRAREEFRRLIEAYAVLKDVIRRAEYDSGMPYEAGDEGDFTPLPVACGTCGSLTAQPRYVVFRTVRSYLIWVKLGHLDGIFCRDCADHAAAKASIVSWLWGWWSLPGLVLTPLALLANLFGGIKPRRENTRILLRQARAFLGRGDLVLARSLVEQAESFARSPEDQARIAALLRATDGAAFGHRRRLKSRWRPGGRVFLAQALPLLALPVTIAIFALIVTRLWDRPASTVSPIAIQPATVGEIRHVAVDGLKLRMAPLPGAPVLTLLDRFTTVEVSTSTDNPDWVGVRSPAGIEGYVETRALYAGSGARFKTEWCTDNRGPPPIAGEILSRRVSGDHRLLLHNDGRRDGVVKLKTLSGSTVLSVYVPATFHIGVGGIPDGTYRIEYATGARYSRGCALFIDGMQASVLPMTVTFHYQSATANRSLTHIAEVWLSPQSNAGPRPLPLPPDRFASDD
ncbi:DnaJ domain-containing protein [Magnetospirillum molischianum]|uniref:J domain-containing protein n=1 Tax=Magnetospirillum molischianum DSM 120 TaxID=1150626 RepID=H8FUB0_MAGML|nr:DnaJ domain-containing protein [Magnetospirillum molischianum]CCG41948.1 conserved hypothetical protein [Magnetospirillum molischianum DSM 120]